MPSVQSLIAKLPPYRDQWIQITPNQTVKDIIIEVCEAHEEFAPYYDCIALSFDADTTEEICNNIYSFLKKNIRYHEETEEDQTTALPTGILVRGFGDCKHYSSMAAGIIDSIQRQTGKKIDWCYRFASYKILDTIPHHVFVVVKDKDGPIWIDPTPGSMNNNPVWFVDKKVKVSDMALTRNIGGVNNEGNYNVFTDIDWEEVSIPKSADAMGKRPFWQLMPAEGVRGADGNRNTNPYFSGPFLGLQHYLEDPYSVEGTNWQTTADAINAAIANGPDPGHTVNADFVKWIYDSSAKGWNFYYINGVRPGYVPNLPAGYPKLIMTADGRLTLDSDAQIDDYMNNEIHALTAWAQSLINQYDPSPYPVKPRHLKEFSQMKQGNLETRNLFTEARGSSFIKEVGKALEDAVNWVKDDAIKIIGSIPRNAFLAMVGLNIFNMAANLQRKITEGRWDEIANTWEKLGGNPEKLLNTINDGKDKPEVNSEKQNTVGEPATFAAIAAAAAPIIAIMLKYLDKDGKLSEGLSAVKGVIEAKWPEVDLSSFDFLDKKTGKQIEIQVDDKDNELKGGGDNKMPPTKMFTGNDPWLDWIKNNPLLAAAIAFAGWELLAPRKMRLINK